MQADVETNGLGLFVDPYSHRQIDHLENDEGHDAAICNCCQDAIKLDPYLANITLDCACRPTDSLDSKYASQDRTDVFIDWVFRLPDAR